MNNWPMGHDHFCPFFFEFGNALAVLVLLFRSFFKPITVLAALPLSLAGAFLGLLVSASELGLPALIGLLMLAGLAARNSIPPQRAHE